MITEKKLRFLEEQATISTDFAELTTFLEIEKYYPEIETNFIAFRCFLFKYS